MNVIFAFIARRLGTIVIAFGLLMAGPLRAEPGLWKIEGAKATIYLFGTVHILRPNTPWRSPKINAALKASNDLRLEIADADNPAAMQPLVLKYGLDAAHPLSSKLDAATKARLETAATGMGTTAAALDPMRPWLAGLTLSALPLIKAGFDPKAGVEQTLSAEFKAAGKSVEGLETAEQQIHLLADLPPRTEIAFLKSSLDDAEKGTDDFDKLVADWDAGDTAALDAFINDEMKAQYPDLYRILIVDRDRAFAKQVAALARGQGVTFIAVGAAHLTGPDSVQAFLAKQGIQAVRQ